MCRKSRVSVWTSIGRRWVNAEYQTHPAEASILNITVAVLAWLSSRAIAAGASLASEWELNPSIRSRPAGTMDALCVVSLCLMMSLFPPRLDGHRVLFNVPIHLRLGGWALIDVVEPLRVPQVVFLPVFLVVAE